jgi:hypothetical protein
LIGVRFRYKSCPVNLASRGRASHRAGLCPLLAAALFASAGCDSSEPHGELVIAVSTDMAMPQQIDNVAVQVLMRGTVVFDQNYAVGSGAEGTMIPATLTLASGSRRDPVTVRVSGQKRGRWRTYREATTTVPVDRSAMLRMPVQWLCDESAKAIPFRDASGVTRIQMASACDAGNTCVAGQCVPTLIDEPMLPDFAAPEVFGGAERPENGECFDTIPCMAAGSIVEPDEDCTVEAPDGDAVNVALRVTNDGICDATTGTICFVPLDEDKVEGWSRRQGSNRLQLPEAVCDKLKSRRVNAVYTSTECATKRPAIPPCGPWSNVGKKQENQGTGGTGVIPTTAPSYPTAQLVATVTREGTSASVCCPLMADGGKMYTCLCTSKTNATLVSIDVATGASTVVGSLNPPSGRDNLRFPAKVSQDALYWGADQEIQRTPILGSSELADRFPIGGAIYESSTMLASGGRIFALASGVANAQGSPVQVIALDPASSVKSFDTGATQPVFQFGQDDAALYLAVDVDEPKEDMKIRRASSVIRLAKADGARTTVIPEQVLEIDDPLRGGGFTGVQVDGASLFALYEGMEGSDGAVPVKVQYVDLNQPPPGLAKTIYETSLDREISQLSMLGAVDGAILLSRIEYEASGNGKTVRSASVIIVRPDETAPQIAADYAKDYPGNDIVSDDRRIYWLNSSGRLYGFPRTALR